MHFRGPRLETDGNVCCRGLDPIETFARSQLAAISLIFMDFHDFHRFSKDFMRCHGFRGSGVEKTCSGLWPTLPARSCSCRNLYSNPAGCYFMDFHRFSKDVMRFHDFRSPGLVLAAISSIFMDFDDFHEIL